MLKLEDVRSSFVAARASYPHAGQWPLVGPFQPLASLAASTRSTFETDGVYDVGTSSSDIYHEELMPYVKGLLDDVSGSGAF